jgi:dolichyl-phosphate-mannose--protein O-mannosyl transferase
MTRVTSDLVTVSVPSTADGDASGPAGSPSPCRPDAARPSLAARLCPPMPKDRFGLGWIAPLLVTGLAALLRFRHLGYPKALVFDETYYAKDAWTLLHSGLEKSWPAGADAKVLQGHPVFDDKAEFVVHPPIGKWLIGLGEQVFGMNPFGWRFAVALLGTLSVLMLARTTRRMTRSTLLGCTAGLLLTLDGLHFVMSRTALLDIILMFFVLAAFGCLVIDRDHTRAKLARLVEQRPPGPFPGPGPRLGFRPWRLAAGLCLGLAVGTKWNGLYFIVVFGVLTVAWDMRARRALGVRRPGRAMLRRDALPAFCSVAVVAVVGYLASWTGWFATSGGWDRQWAPATGGGVVNSVTRALRGFAHYHSEILYFHTHLHAFHPYKSNPWSWLVIGRPVSYYYQTVGSTHAFCGAKQCAQETLAIGTPVLWWAALLALPYMLWRWIGHRDWRFGAAVCGIAAGYLPWFAFTDRTIFYFYSVAFLPFMVLGLTLTLGVLLGPDGATARRRAIGGSAAGLLVLLVALNFIYLLPVLRADTISMAAWQARMWFPSWI